jgi:thymidylate synthase
MQVFEYEYKRLVNDIIEQGIELNGRNGKMRSLINTSLTASPNKLPIITGKKVFYNKAIAEFIWMLEGKSDIEFLHAHNIHWWDTYAVNGQVPKAYGYQLRKDPDQIQYVLDELKKPFTSRRARISLWQPRDLKEQVIPCCYTEFDFIKRPDGLQMVMTFRSSDIFLGFPYDALIGFLLLDYIANKIKIKPHSISYNFINVHIYEEHIEAVKSYLNTPYGEGSLTINKPGEVDGYTVTIKNQGKYIKAPLIL